MKILILTLCLMFFRAGADEWKHINMESEEGIVITLDYLIRHYRGGGYKPHEYWQAEETYINLRGGDLGPDSRVTIVFMNYHLGSYGTMPVAYKMVDVPWYGDHFTGKVEDSIEIRQGPYIFRAIDQNPNKWQPVQIHSQGYGGRRDFYQAIAIVVDGNWLSLKGSPEEKNLKCKMYF